MIAKAVKGKGFRGALEYDLTKEGGQILDTNMAGENTRELAAEFGEIRKLRPNLGKAVLHVSLSAAPGEKLTNEQWREIGKRYMDAMGLEKNQFVLTRHNDTEHEHIHILVNRIRFDGSVTSDSQDYKRQEAIMRELERAYGLQRVAPSLEAGRKAPTKGEIEGGIRTGQPSAKQQLQQLCDAAAKNSRSFTEYQERLKDVGVELMPVVQLGGAKLSGLSYSLDGVTMKGSDLGKDYSPAGLSKRGVTYEQNRDFAAVSASNERNTNGAISEPNRDSTPDQTPEHRGLERDARAVSASVSGIDGRNTAIDSRNQPNEPGAERNVQSPTSGINEKLHTGSSGGGQSRLQPEPSGPSDRVETLHLIPVGGADYGNARERILDLAGTADRAERVGRERVSRVPETRIDKSLEALKKQITALDVPRFEVGIREAKTGKMVNREWSRTEVEQSAAWLKRMNAKGNDVYIRPAGEHGLVLIDDLTADKITSMAKDGYTPAATIETSPGNYQAWVKLSDKPLSPETRRIAAQELAKQYGGDLNSADSKHYGRLAGFTNQKPQHTRDGRQPYVLAHNSPGIVARAALAYLGRIEQGIDKAKAHKENETRLKAIKTVYTGHKTYNPTHEYQRQAQRLLTKYGENSDLSRMDWMIATEMAKSGWTKQDVEKGIREASPALDSRKVGHIEDYAKRTTEKAFAAPEVQQHREERAQQAKRDRDRGESR